MAADDHCYSYKTMDILYGLQLKLYYDMQNKQSKRQTIYIKMLQFLGAILGVFLVY